VLREAADSELALATRREALEAAGAGLQEAAAVGPIDPRRFEWGQVGR
jgi:hypothetical protein